MAHLALQPSGAEATFQPKWSLFIAVEFTGKYRATDALTCFPTLIPPQSISAEPDRGNCDIQDSVLQLVASGCRKAVPGTQRSGDSSPAISHHMGGALRPRRLSCKEGAHLLREYRAFSKAGATSPHSDPGCPKSIRGNKKLCYSTTYWKTKERWLHINWLNSEKN